MQKIFKNVFKKKVDLFKKITIFFKNNKMKKND